MKEINKVDSFKRTTFPGNGRADCETFGGGPQVPAEPNSGEAKSGKGGDYDKALLNKGKVTTTPGGTPAGKKGTGGTNEFSSFMRMAESVIKEHDGSATGISDGAKKGVYGDQ